MKALLAIAAALLVPSIVGTAAGAQTAPEARSIVIPFDPPLGRRLVYRGERVGIGETTPATPASRSSSSVPARASS